MRREPLALARLLGGLVVLFTMLTWAGPQPRADAAVGATLTIHNRICPAEFTGPDYFGTCHGTPPGIAFEFTLAGPETRTGTLDTAGNATFSDLLLGTYEVSGGPPGDFTRLTVFCASASDLGTSYPVTVNDSTFTIDLTSGSDVICDYYNTPEGGRGETGSLTIYKSTCPVGYTGDDFFADCYPNATANVTFTLALEGGGVLGTSKTDANGFAFFENLDGAYIVEEDIPGEFATATAYCTAGGVAVPIGFAGDNSRFRIDVDASQDIRCDYYNIPFDLRGETPTAVPTVAPPAPTAAPAATTAPVTTLPSTGTHPTGGGHASSALLPVTAALALLGSWFGFATLRRRAPR